MKGTGEYAPDQAEINERIKEFWGWQCERCGHGHEPAAGYTLTVHHLDGAKGNNALWNLAALCQRCHLKVQGKVFMPQFYMFEHSEWLKPHLVGYYGSLGLATEFYYVDGRRHIGFVKLGKGVT